MAPHDPPTTTSPSPSSAAVAAGHSSNSTTTATSSSSGGSGSRPPSRRGRTTSSRQSSSSSSSSVVAGGASKAGQKPIGNAPQVGICFRLHAGRVSGGRVGGDSVRRHPWGLYVLNAVACLMIPLPTTPGPSLPRLPLASASGTGPDPDFNSACSSPPVSPPAISATFPSPSYPASHPPAPPHPSPPPPPSPPPFFCPCCCQMIVRLRVCTRTWLPLSYSQSLCGAGELWRYEDWAPAADWDKGQGAARPSGLPTG